MHFYQTYLQICPSRAYVITGQVLCLTWQPDEEYVQMVESVKGRMMSQDRKNKTAKIDDFSPVVMLTGKHFLKTVRVL